MNPHFIFNALNSVQSLIGSEDEKTARFQLSRFSRLMRQILESSREELIPLQLEINILENYLNLENFIHGNHFKFEFIIDGNYQPEEVLIPAMMVHPFVENAVIHGLSSRKNGSIEIRFIIDELHLTAIITDNGVGREKAKINNLQRDPSHKSTALLVVEERLKLFNISGKPEITDLYDQNIAPAGTQVKIVLPVKHVF
jgi:sensor histidine kinase YesM